MITNRAPAKEGTAVDHAEYPEKVKRESMLWDVHEWFQEQADYDPVLIYYEIESMGVPPDAVEAGTEAGETATQRHKVQQVSLFMRLQQEGYINADLRRDV